MTAIKNAVVLFLLLAIGLYSKQPDFDELKNRFKFFVRGVFTFPYTIQWLAFLNSYSEYKTFLWKNPRLATKLHRPYMIRSCSLKQQLHILKSHYQIQASLFSSDQQLRLLSGEHFLLCKFTGKNGKEYRITLNQNLRFQKEGELALQVSIGEKALCILSFSFYEVSNHKAVLIGGLQGPEHQDYDLVKEATKACFGIFPKKLALEILVEYLQYWRMEVYAISNDGHIYQHWRYNKAILADYDKFWLELGAYKLTNQIYKLAYPIYHRPIEEVESKKRSEHKKRKILMVELKNQLNDLF